MTTQDIILSTLLRFGPMGITALERRLAAKGVRYHQVPGSLQDLIRAGKVGVSLGLYSVRAAS